MANRVVSSRVRGPLGVLVYQIGDVVWSVFVLVFFLARMDAWSQADFFPTRKFTVRGAFATWINEVLTAAYGEPRGHFFVGRALHVFSWQFCVFENRLKTRFKN